MQIGKFIVLLCCCCIVSSLGGCGNSGGGDLVGSLSLDTSTTDLTGGYYDASATATYSHPTKDPIGTDITFNTVAFTNRSTLGVSNSTHKVNSSGAITVTYGPFQQRNIPIFIDINANTGDLTQFKRVTIPALSSLGVTPGAVAFAGTDPVGTTKTVTVSGGISPYVISSSSANIGVSINGNTVTVTLLASGGGTSSATVTVKDALGNSVAIAVGY